MARPARVSPDRILTAAAPEFAQRGYGGAGVDRIARRARVNKAMIYYHFGSKRELYRALLRQTFADVASTLETIAASADPAARKFEHVVSTLAHFIAERPSFPAIMLREVAEGGAHLDRETLTALAAVPLAIGRIVQQGIGRGEVRPMHPLAAHFTIVAPLVMFSAFAPIRKQLTSKHLAAVASISPDEFLRQLQESIRRALVLTPPSTREHR